MKKIVVASKNPVKMNASLEGFQKMFPSETFVIEGVSVSSEVADQPRTDEETYLGAWNRVKNAAIVLPEADFWIGIEGGVADTDHGMEEFAWVIVKSHDGRIGKGKTGTFFLPPQIAKLIREGKELGEADDLVFGRQNSKESNGAVGILTGDVVHRTNYCVQAIVFALIPFRNESLY